MNDGGPAFPVDFVQLPNSSWTPGMSLRDWFAGMALQGLLAMSADPSIKEVNPKDESMRAYAYADAMLKERSK